MAYYEEPNPKYIYQPTSLPTPKNDMFNMYKPHYNQQPEKREEEFMQKNSEPSQYVRSSINPKENEQLLTNSSQNRNHHNQSYVPHNFCFNQPQLPENVTSDVVYHHSREPTSESMPEEYDNRNRKNFAEYYNEKRTRPYCPFLRKGRCPSSRCLYYHPIIISYDEHPFSRSLHPDAVQEQSQPMAYGSNPPADDEPHEDNSMCPPTVETKIPYNQPEQIPMTRTYNSQPNNSYQASPLNYQPEDNYQYTNMFHQSYPQKISTHHSDKFQASFSPNTYQPGTANSQICNSEPHYSHLSNFNLHQY